MKKTSKLKQGQQQYLEHAQGAKDRGITLARYCRETGLNAQVFYNTTSALRKKVMLSSPVTPTFKSGKPSAFMAVRIAPQSAPPTSMLPSTPVVGGMCRLRHPNGWVMECASLPPASWMRQVLNGGAYVRN